MTTIIDLLEHLKPEQKNELEQVEDEIYELQGKLQTYEDTLKLAGLYQKRNRILKGKSEETEND
ncbi:hypothetical protein ODU73_002174 [Thermoclostridium stercorarium]|uniref:hypothetical protein n=1 Tax=Thermoclostridium stercorarium TaxID=1510 RepID=UPI00224974FA|nr:hypothetical protein [Thermoclostridium stercorarium]UZQ85072.1 hypothetical protein ODU73_002174 [Thermoclostridium stercorarium]